MATEIGSSWTELVEYASSYSSYTITYRLYAKYSASSIPNNTHTIQLKWTTQKTSGGTGVYDNDNTTPSVSNISNGNPTSWTGTAFNIPTGSTAETDRTTSGNIVVTHNSNGTYSATWSWSLSHVYEGGSKSGTVAVTLPTIPRASSFTLSSNNIYSNGSTTATITRADSSFTHKITGVYNSTTYYFLGSSSSASTSTSASLTVPTALRTAMKSANAKSISITLTLTTYSGSTTIGTATTSLTITVPTATVTVTPSSVACNSATTSWTLGNVDTTACTYTVQRLYGSTVRYTDSTQAITTTKSSLANALFEANITTATSGTVTVKVTTYVGTTTVGTNTVTYTVTIPTGTYKPSITFNSATRTGSTYGSIAYLAGYNGATATFTTSVTGSSAIDSRSVIITNNITSTSLSYSGNTITVTTGTFPSNSSNYSVTITVTVRDKRGTSASASTTLTISGYAKPSVTASATRANSGGTADTEGTYANLTATGRAHTNASIASMQIKYGSTSVKTATSATVTQNGYRYNSSPFDVQNSYTFTAIATDNLGFSTTISFVLASASYVLSLHPSGGVGMGMVASANRVDIAYKQVNNSYGNDAEISVSNNAYRIGLHMGSGGTNRGLYDFAETSGSNSWVIYKNGNNDTVVNSNNFIVFNSVVKPFAHQNHYIIPNIYYNGATAGYYVLCTITVTGTYCDMPFYFKVLKRGTTIANLTLRLTSTNSGATHSVSVFEVNESNTGYYYVYESAENTFQILMNKPAYSSVCLADFQTGTYNTERCTIDFTTSFLSSLPSGAVQATQTKFVATWADGATTANVTNNLVLSDRTTNIGDGRIIFGATSGTGTKGVSTADSLKFNFGYGTTSSAGWSEIILGNSTPIGTAGNQYGVIRLYATNDKYVYLRTATAPSASGTIYLPNKYGTIALEPVELYANGNGTTGTVTLSETSANFTYLDIYYYSVPTASTSTKRYGHTRVAYANGKTVSLTNTVYWSNYLEITHRTIVISGTSITNASNEQAQFRITSGSSPSRSSTSSLIYIIRVEGIR